MEEDNGQYRDRSHGQVGRVALSRRRNSVEDAWAVPVVRPEMNHAPSGVSQDGTIRSPPAKSPALSVRRLIVSSIQLAPDRSECCGWRTVWRA